MSNEIPEGEIPPDPYDLNYRFFLYLKKLGRDPRTLPFGQYAEIKRAFFGGLGMMMMITSLELPVLNENDSANKIKFMSEQITEFWKQEVERGPARQN